MDLDHWLSLQLLSLLEGWAWSWIHRFLFSHLMHKPYALKPYKIFICRLILCSISSLKAKFLPPFSIYYLLFAFQHALHSTFLMIWCLKKLYEIWLSSHPLASVHLWEGFTEACSSLQRNITQEKEAYAEKTNKQTNKQTKQSEIFTNGTLYFRLCSVLPTVLDRQLSLCPNYF